MKRTVAAILITLLLICLTSAVAAGGTASDPLISRSYIDDTYIPKMLADGQARIDTELGTVYNAAAAELETRYARFAALAGGDAYAYASGFTPLYTSLDSTVSLLPGSSLICLQGGASIRVAAGTVLDVSAGSTVDSGAALVQGHRYFCAEETAAVVTGASTGSMLVDGYYRASDDVGTVIAPAPGAICATRQAIRFNGELVDMEVYNIDDYNYFKLRDVAYLMMNTGSRFSVAAIGERALIDTACGADYVPVGGELVKGEDRSDTCVPSAWRLLVGGKCAAVIGYNLGGNNFFKLRDLGDALNFLVDYDPDTGTMLIDSK